MRHMLDVVEVKDKLNALIAGRSLDGLDSATHVRVMSIFKAIYRDAELMVEIRRMQELQADGENDA